MKTKIIRIFAILLIWTSVTLAQTNPPYAVDYTTPTVVSGVTHYGDVYPVPWIKYNSNWVWAAQQFYNVNANVYSLSNSVLVNTANIATNAAALAYQATLFSNFTNFVATNNFLGTLPAQVATNTVNIASNTAAITALSAAIAALQAQLALLTNGITTNFQYVTGTLLSLTNHTATFTNGVFSGTTP